MQILIQESFKHGIKTVLQNNVNLFLFVMCGTNHSAYLTFAFTMDRRKYPCKHLMVKHVQLFFFHEIDTKSRKKLNF